MLQNKAHGSQKTLVNTLNDAVSYGSDKTLMSFNAAWLEAGLMGFHIIVSVGAQHRGVSPELEKTSWRRSGEDHTDCSSPFLLWTLDFVTHSVGLDVHTSLIDSATQTHTRGGES